MNPSLGRALPFPAGFFSSAAVPLPPGRFRGPKRLLRGPRGAAGGAAGAAGAPPAPGGAPAAGRRSTRAPHARPPGAAGGAPPPARPRPRCPPARAAGLGVGQGGWPSPARRGLAVEPRRPRRGRGRPGRRGGGGGPGAAAAAPPPAARPAPRPAGARGEFGEFVFFSRPPARRAAPRRAGRPLGQLSGLGGARRDVSCRVTRHVTCRVAAPGARPPRAPRPAPGGLRAAGPPEEGAALLPPRGLPPRRAPGAPPGAPAAASARSPSPPAPTRPPARASGWAGRGGRGLEGRPRSRAISGPRGGASGGRRGR